MKSFGIKLDLLNDVSTILRNELLLDFFRLNFQTLILANQN